MNLNHRQPPRPHRCADGATGRLQAERSAFTLIEMLVVISIIAVLTALIAGLTSSAGPAKVRNRAMTEMHQYITAIESYQKKFGLYPPDNPNSTAQPPLYYELAGQDPMPAAALLPLMGVNGIVNTNQNFIPNVSPSHWAQNPGPAPQPYFLIFDYKGPSGQYNTWNYRSSKPEHNTESYDLWLEVVVGGKTYTIANWKE
jgi:prepilin-type N-terminal cleavage/methylation domain-containing protein